MHRGLIVITTIAGTIAVLILSFGFFLVLHNNDAKVNLQISQNAPLIFVPFLKIADGQQSKINTRVNYLLTSSAELSAIWKTVGATSTLPQVDFDNNSVLAVFSGTKGSGPISISKIQDSNERMVSITIFNKQGSCTKPSESAFEIVLVGNTKLPITHEDSIIDSPCP